MDNQRKKEFNKIYLEVAKSFSKLSRARKLKVGAILVKDKNILSFGYNGTLSGRDNNCENLTQTGKLKTKQEVMHAEVNCILKAAKSTYSTEGAILYQTMSPCFECCKIIIQAGISKVVYSEEYKNTSGIELLKSVGIEVEHFKEEEIIKQSCKDCIYGAKKVCSKELQYIFREIYKRDSFNKIININYNNKEFGCRSTKWNEREERCLLNNFSEFEE